MYKTVVVDYAPKAKKMAAAIEKKSNELAQGGWELVSCAITPSCKAILVFRVPENAEQAQIAQEETVEAVEETE